MKHRSRFKYPKKKPSLRTSILISPRLCTSARLNFIPTQLCCLFADSRNVFQDPQDCSLERPRVDVAWLDNRPAGICYVQKCTNPSNVCSVLQSLSVWSLRNVLYNVRANARTACSTLLLLLPLTVFQDQSLYSCTARRRRIGSDRRRDLERGIFWIGAFPQHMPQYIVQRRISNKCEMF